MATAEQIKMLIKAHFNNKDEQFRTAVLQIAAYEAQQGHKKLARELKEILEKNRFRSNVINISNSNQLFIHTPTDVYLRDLIVSNDLQERIKRILQEFKQRDRLRHYGLANRRKVLLEGASGTGKTMTAKIIASELQLPLFTIQMDKLVTKFMGETSSKLRQIFDMIASTIGVYLFDEFDAIGSDRNLDTDVGEMRRVLNSFLQLIEQDASDSIIIAATNNRRMLDQALFRRFDDVLHYDLPNRENVKRLIGVKLADFVSHNIINDDVINLAVTLSQAEITRACEDVIKLSILSDRSITSNLLIQTFQERLLAYNKEA